MKELEDVSRTRPAMRAAHDILVTAPYVTDCAGDMHRSRDSCFQQNLSRYRDGTASMVPIEELKIL